MSERWVHALLIGLLMGHLLLLSSRPEARGSTLEQLVLEALGPIGHSASLTHGALSTVLSSARSRRALRAENEALREQLRAQSEELVRLTGVEEELERLSRLSAYARRPRSGFFIADVVLVDRASWLRTLVIYTGAEELRKNQPVMTQQGLVGRVVVASGRYAKVQLITDRSSSVSAMIRRSRRQGLVRGDAEGGLELTLVPKQDEVHVGDEVVTAGIDGVFPRGVSIGRVREVASVPGLFHQISLEPAVDLGRVDQVYVLGLETIPPQLREVLSDDPG